MTAIRNLRRAGLIASLLLLVILPCTAADIQVEVNGSLLAFTVPPTQVNGRTMVPLRGIFEYLGAQVNWDASTRRITAANADADVQLGIGDSRARVNGRDVELDAPATIVRGTTMVPLRFVSEALGADVKWLEAARMVSITTYGEPTPGATAQSVVIPAGTVIPVRLDKALSSKTNRKGDAVAATVRSVYEGDAEFPRGTRIVGVVSEAQQAGGGDPGTLSLAFREVVLPDGHKISAEGSLVSLDEKLVKQTSDGHLVMREQSKSNDQLKFIGIGAAGGFLLGKLTKHTLEGTLLGAAAGYLYSENVRKKMQPTDVSVAEGTEFGVELNRQVVYNPGRAFILARQDFLKTLPSSVTPTPQNVRVIAGGREVAFVGAQPRVEEGIVLVPLAPVMDQAGISYKYDERLKAVSLDTEQGALQMNIGKSYALLNGEREELEAPAQMRDGVVFVPLHFLALATGTRVVWVADTRMVTMYARS